ncbi:zinc-ribbon domain-containing protein [Limimaricola variabilis]
MGKARQPLSEHWNLLACYPEIAAEWDMERNSPNRPEGVTPGSSRVVWWKCRVNPEHHWQAAVATRRAGHGCGVCAGKIAGPDNSVAARAPHLVDEWHRERNGANTPDNTLFGSRKKIRWRCAFGHEWTATPNNRISGGSGCPRCAKSGTSRIELRVAAELITLFEDADWRQKVAGREIDVLLPSIGIGIEVDGHYWHSQSREKEAEKERVLIEAGLRLLRLRDNRLPPTDAENVTFSHEESDEQFMSRLADQLAALCDNSGHHGPAAILRGYAHTGQLVGEVLFSEMIENLPGPPAGRSFADRAGEAALDWDEEANGTLRPTQFWPHSHYPAHWRCRTCGHYWRVSIGSRTAGNGCPRCAGRVATLETSFAGLHPQLLADWDWERNDLDPEAILPQSNRMAHWRCATGHRWHARVQMRVNGNTCPKCRLAANSLAAKRPDIAAEWHSAANHPETPNKVSYGSKRKATWQCRRDDSHVWVAGINTRTSGSGCPFCAGKRVSPETSLATKRPDIAAQWDAEANGTQTPDDVTAGSDKTAWWRCRRGHSWSATVRSRVAGSGCPRCADPLCDVDFDDLPKTQLEAKKLNSKFYYTGKPCRHGHFAPRMTGNKNCRECGRLRSKKYYETGSGAGAM